MAKRSTTRINELTVSVFEPDGASKATILFSHGAWVGGWIWDDFAAWFADHGYTCFCPTWRGHYDSKPVDDLGKVRFGEFVEDCLEVAREVNARVLIGESMGGLIALKTAESYAPNALVLMNPAPPFMPPFNPNLFVKQVKYLADLVYGRPNHPKEKDYRGLILNNLEAGEAAEFYKRTCAESGTALRELSLGKVKVDSNKITCPVTVIIGHLDAILSVKVHRKTARLLGADLVEYPSMSHHTFSERGWERVADDLAGWLAKLQIQPV